jgi:hypothetical protein
MFCLTLTPANNQLPRKHQLHLGDDYREIAFKIGEFVYMRTADEPQRGQVVGYVVIPGALWYSVCWGPDGTEKRHYEFELSTSAFVMETEDNESEPESEE